MTADLFTVVSDRFARAFNRSGATRAVALDIYKAPDRVWYAALLYKLKSYGISGQIFGLISSFLSNRQHQVALNGKSSKEYPVNAGVRQVSLLGSASIQQLAYVAYVCTATFICIRMILECVY